MANHKKAAIIWLDPNISRLDYCQTLKKTIARALVPDLSHSTFLDDNTIDKLIKDVFSKNPYSFENSAIELHTFSDEEECAQCIEENKNKKIFFIVSNSLGKRIVPQIVKKCPEALQKSVDDRCRSVYVFCYNSSVADQLWATKYSEYMLVCTSETDLSRRLINDIGGYFVSLGQEQSVYGTDSSLHQLLQYLYWAKTLLGRAFGVVDAWQCRESLRNIDNQIAEFEAKLQQVSNSVDIDQCILCSGAADEGEAEMPELYEQVHLNASSFPVRTEPTNVESSSLWPESATGVSSEYIREKLASQTNKSADDQQGSPDIHVYLQRPATQTENFNSLYSILKHLFGTNLVVSPEGQDYYELAKSNDLPIIVQSLSSDDDRRALEKVCLLGTGISLYLLGTEPDTINSRQDFFTRYPQVYTISNDPEELAVKIALDVALKSRKMGDRYARNGDKNRANKMYDQCIELLNGLNALALQNMDNKD
jgi:hypothetical protein